MQVSIICASSKDYDLFDDLVLLYDGHIVYQGPREHVIEFFESTRFKCPERKRVADFLQEVTSKLDQQQHWVRRHEPYRFVTASIFAEAYRSFHVRVKLGDELSIPFDKSKSHPAALTTKKYGVNKKELLKVCSTREILLMKRNSFVYIFKLRQTTFMSIIGMTLFFRTKMPRDDATDGTMIMFLLMWWHQSNIVLLQTRPMMLSTSSAIIGARFKHMFFYFYGFLVLMLCKH